MTPIPCPRCGESKPEGDSLCADCFLDLRILHALEDKCGEPMTRAELEALTKLPDRTNRRAIERLRQRGKAVVASSSQAGYHLAQNMAERQALRDYYKGVALTMLMTHNALARAEAEECGKQTVLVEIVWEADGQGRLIA